MGLKEEIKNYEDQKEVQMKNLAADFDAKIAALKKQLKNEKPKAKEVSEKVEE